MTATVEQLVRESHRMLEAAGVHISPSKISRVTRKYVRDGIGVPFGTYLAASVAIRPDVQRELDQLARMMTEHPMPAANRGRGSFWKASK